MSFRNTSCKTEVVYVETKDFPKIIFPAKVIAIMEHIVKNVSDEVGWLGAVEQKDNAYWITDIYLPKQEVNGGTCELAPDGMHDLCDWMIKNGHEDKVNRVHFWGHSHVNMSVQPSGQDLQQSEEKLRDFGGTFFIRAICNKSGEMSVAFYDGVNKRRIENIEWYIYDGVDRKAISDIYGKLIESNVKKLVYPPPTNLAENNNIDERWNTYENRDTHYLEDRFNKSSKHGRKTHVTLKGVN